VKFTWAKEQQEAFELLKQAIAQPPVLRMADFGKPFILQTDARGVALGAVLSQEIDGVRLPIAHASRTHTAQERKASSVYELECLAVLFGTEKFRRYIEHQEFILETDNQAISWLLLHSRQLGKIGRGFVKISALKFKVRHIRGTQNIVADVLPRMFGTPPIKEASVSCAVTLTEFPLAFQGLKQLQLQDPVLVDIKGKLERGVKVQNYLLSRGILYWRSSKGRRQKLVAPESAKAMIFAYFHDSPLGVHLGVAKTVSKIRDHFVWTGMDKEIRAKVRECHGSVSKPAQNTLFGFLASEVPQRPMQKLFIDFVGKFPRSKAGNTAILVCVDEFSKFVWLIPVRNTTTRATTKALKEKIFSSFSVPETLVSDNAQSFTSRDFRHFCFELGVKHVHISPYHPQPSHAERFNKHLRAALIAYHRDAHDTWDQQLTWWQLAFNTAEHEATKSPPFVVMFPFRSGSPLLNRWKIHELLPGKCNERDLQQRWVAVRQNLCKSLANRERRYNQNRGPQPFKIGDLVYYKNHPIIHAGRQIAAKLMSRYKGPFKVDGFLTTVTVSLGYPSTGRIITKAQVSLLKAGHAAID
jgi:transposase InsO family protein